MEAGLELGRESGDHASEADDERDQHLDDEPMHRVEAVVDALEAGFYVDTKFAQAPFDTIEAVVDLVEATVDSVEAIVDAIEALFEALVGPTLGHGRHDRTVTGCLQRVARRMARNCNGSPARAVT